VRDLSVTICVTKAFEVPFPADVWRAWIVVRVEIAEREVETDNIPCGVLVVVRHGWPVVGRGVSSQSLSVTGSGGSGFRRIGPRGLGQVERWKSYTELLHEDLPKGCG
jgi:hypothetical protein